MRFAAAFAGLAAGLASAAANLPVSNLGFSLGSVNPDGSNKTTQDYKADLKAIKANTGSNFIRTYAASQNDQAANLMPAAASEDFMVVLGIWVVNSADTSSYNLDLAAIQSVAETYKDNIYAVTIGSEGLYRGNYTDADIVKLVSDFRGKVPSVSRVGTADTWNSFTDGKADAIIKSPNVNFIAANAFAFWQNSGTAINNASYVLHDDYQQTLAYVQNLRSNNEVEVVVGETGWPTGGGGYGDPSTDHYSDANITNAQKFFTEGVCAMVGNEWARKVFVFEAFDEPLKPNATGLNGQSLEETHWGIMDSSRQLKDGFNPRCGN